ncbi:hypothetical protein FHS50_002018 [Sphingomicrobium lutaoense]|uniref:Uncharacterized protein n=1 Tax=Sphingomicrobium lutaoense TaxID=515949 RepID=A0A839Z125_9SPHN|nr:hypothetical protein [Sphingomicrobium lutaoense]
MTRSITLFRICPTAAAMSAYRHAWKRRAMETSQP